MKLLKRISIFVSMVLACVMAKAADYEIKAANISVIEGGTTTLAIELKNAGEVVGFQCDISLPEGVKLSGEMTMLRHQEGVHVLVKKEQPDGSMRVLVYSNPNTPFTGNEGVVLNVPLSVGASIGSYSIGLKNPVITAPGAVAHYADASTVTLTVKPKYIDANAVTLNKSSLELLIGGTEQLIATVSPDNATDKTVVWTSSDNSVATVDANGNITAVALGSATITASCGSVKAECKITVLPIAATAVTLNKSSLELLIGDTEQLIATVSPDNATDKTVVWTSSDNSVATVDANGNVTAVALGSATITASCGSVKAECKITVLPIAATAVTLNKSSLELLIGGTEQLIATVSPDNATDKTISWTSSNNSVATVDANGNVTAVALGNATITASCGSVKAECKVTVLPIAATAVTLNKSSLELLIGGTEQLIATVSPDNATDKTISWTSSDNSVAAVDANGNITAVALGSATITASCGSVKAECKVTVLPIAVSLITLNKTEMELFVGGSEQLSFTVSPDNATDKTVVWTSSDNSVATVDANGNVTAVALGSATITASCGSVKAECKVTVLPIAVSELTLNKTEMKIFVGGSSQLVATISPDNATNKTIVWTSSDNSIATVDANGNVQAIAVGTAIITASCDSVTAECKVTIIKRSQTITWNQKFNNIKDGDKIELTATASSGLDVVYTVLEGDAVVQGNTLTLNAPGQVRVEASQPGNDEYNAARTVVKKITVLPIPASEVSLNKAELELLIGGTEQLIATVSPDNASDKTVVWTSSDSNIVTVDENGLVQAIAAGNAIITASCGEVKAECQVTVLKKEQTITWDQAFDDVTEGNTIELNATASSGLDVVYKVIEGDAVIEGKLLTINTSGKISIEASQPGDNEFYSAQPVVKTFNVTSGIFDIKSESKKAIYYDIKGRVVKNPKNGVYIVNGRKVFIK